MALVVTYNGYTFSRPRYERTEEPLRNASGRQRARRVAVKVWSEFEGADAEDLASKIAAARVALLADGGNLAVTLDGKQLFVLASAAALPPGVRARPLAFPREGYAAIQPLVMEFEGEFPTGSLGDQVVERSETYTSSIDSNGLESRTWAGYLISGTGVSAMSAFLATLPALTNGWAASYQGKVDPADDRRCEYGVTHRQYSEALPDGALDGGVVMAYREDSAGRRTVAASGGYSGPGAEDAARGHIPEEAELTTYEEASDSRTGVLSFRYEWLDHEVGETYAYGESTRKWGGGPEIETVLFRGVAPLLMETAQTAARVIQAGAKTGYKAYPEPAPYLYDEKLLAKKPEIQKTRGDGGEYRISWSYEFVFATDPGGPIGPAEGE